MAECSFRVIPTLEGWPASLHPAFRAAATPLAAQGDETRLGPGHHDFQSWAKMSLPDLKVLQIRDFTATSILAVMFANCDCFSRIWALDRG
jgi:hypothetical protein